MVLSMIGGKLSKGRIPIRIHSDGRWFYNDSPIERNAMVRLFAKQLMTIDNDYYIQAPEQTLKIEVDDLPFVIVEVERHDPGAAQQIIATTNCGDEFVVGDGHRINLSLPPGQMTEVPKVHVRDGLYARASRSCYYQLVEWGVPNEIQGILLLQSSGIKYTLGRL